MNFPTFDLAAFEATSGAARKAKAAEMDQICRETGFLILTGHGVAADVIADQWDAVQRFFAQSPAVKQQAAAPYVGYPYGYLGPNSEALAKSRGEDTPPDLKESFNGGPAAIPSHVTDPDALAFCYVPTPWPEVTGFQAAWEAYYAQMEALARRIMAAFAESLDLAPDYFAPAISDPISALRALHYPATQEVPLDKQQRAGAHSDYGSLTILLPQAGSTGLQIGDRARWIDVPAPEGAFVINIGDLMARWTADRWVSTLHRVIAKPDQPARQSLAFFHQPNWDAEITPLDGSDAYAPVRSGPYLMEKFRSTGG
jgi:isopenicillin N synthase-like dioxygenase